MAKAVLAALPNPRFFICFFIDDKIPNRIDLLVHGKVQLIELASLHRMVDEIIDEQAKKFQPSIAKALNRRNGQMI